MYIGIPRKEKENSTMRERQQKKCCYRSNGRQERLPRKNNRRGQGSKRCYTDQGTQQSLGLQKNGQKNDSEKIKPKCTMKEKELEQDGMKGDGS
jgi:hypothetical protein